MDSNRFWTEVRPPPRRWSNIQCYYVTNNSLSLNYFEKAKFFRHNYALKQYGGGVFALVRKGNDPSNGGIFSLGSSGRENDDGDEAP